MSSVVIDDDDDDDGGGGGGAADDDDGGGGGGGGDGGDDHSGGGDGDGDGDGGAGCGVDSTVHVGIIQGAVTHALYRLRSFSSVEYSGRLANYGQYADRGNLLRTLRWSHDYHNSILRHIQATLPRKGIYAISP